MKIKTVLVRKKFPGHCNYSGYDRLFENINNKISGVINVSDNYRKRYWFPASFCTFLRKKYNLGTLFYKERDSIQIELQTLLSAYLSKTELIHFGYFEDHYGLFRSSRICQRLSASKIIATVHCPSSWWKLYYNPHMVNRLDGIIVLSDSDVSFFENYLPGKVCCVPHGIDTDFFKPAPEKKENNIFRCVFAGQWLRDIETLVYVVEKLLLRKQDIVFDIFYPPWKRHNRDYLYRIMNNPNVIFHDHVSDEVLREHYQQADILLLPLFDCTANNAVLEGMACGLPIVSNAVPGIHTYVKETFSILTPVGDVDSMVDAVMTYYDDRELIRQHSTQAREYALRNFTWDNIADQVIQTYGHILGYGE